MITEKGAVGMVKGVKKSSDGTFLVRCTTVGDDNVTSAWFLTFNENPPEEDKFIQITNFKFTAVPKDKRFPTKLEITGWDYIEE